MAEKLRDTPTIDELMKGPWPSFIKEIKLAAEDNPRANDLLGVLERSYNEKIGHWKHGGIVGVMGYGGGVIGRYSFLAKEFPHVAHFQHHVQRLTVVFNIEPVPNIKPIPVYGQRLSIE